MPNWTGKWIWCEGEASPKNFYAYTRKVINLPAKPKKAPARVCADSRYKLFVNGKLVGRGPTRSFPQFQHYDEYDLAKALKPGENVIAALVHHYGEGTFQYHLGRGAFLFDAQIECDGKKTAVGSDSSWKMIASDAWYRDLPRIDVQLEFQEVYDMNKAPEGWASVGFDDSKWKSAVVVGPVGTPPWKLIPRDIPFLPEQLIFPAKVLQTGASDASGVELAANDKMNISLLQQMEKRDPAAKSLVTNAASLARKPQIDDLLASELMRPDGEPARLMKARCDEANAGLKSVVVKPSPDGRSTYIVLDFGKEVMGYPVFRVRSNSGGVVDMGYCEILENGIVNSNRGGVRYADRIVLKPGTQEFETFDKRAFRYMQLDFRELKGPVTLDWVGVRFCTYPVKWRGEFACSDKTLNEIWKMSAYTVQLNMEDGYTDCPWRERAQWWGDARIEALINYYAFGDAALIRQGIREIARSQHEDGITNCFAPGEMGPCTPIPSFTLIWILSLSDYYDYTGDKALVEEIYPNVKKALGWFTSRIDNMGLVSNTNNWMFIDWAGMDMRGAVTSLQCFFVGALTEAAELARIVKKDADAVKYLETAEKIKKAVNEHCFNTEKGVYVDCYAEGAPSKTVSEQTNSVAVVYGVAPKEKWQSILDYVHDPKGEVVRAGSPYFSFYVLEALWKVGQDQRAFDYIRNRWGEMLAKGATACWETWGDTSSHCHGWSGAPAVHLPGHVLGVRPLAPAFAKFEVAPERFGLKWAEGTIPTPRGDIEVYWKVSGQGCPETTQRGFTLGVTVPRGATAQVTLPDKVDPKLVKANGKKALPEGVRALASKDGRPVYSVKSGQQVVFSY